MNTSRQSMEAVVSTALDSKPGTASVSLREMLDRQTPGRMPLHVGFQIMLAAGEVLARAHERGGGAGLHGNMDPNCVDVDHLGAVRIRGFGEGIASRRRSPYQAPELRRGEVADVLADVYSLAAMLYEVCTGYSCMQAATREPCRGAEPVPRPSRLNPRIDASFDLLMLRALAVDSAERPPSVRALLNEMRLIVRTLDIDVSQSRVKRYVDEQLPWLAIRASGRIATPPPRPATPGPVLSMPAPPPSDPGQLPALFVPEPGVQAPQPGPVFVPVEPVFSAAEPVLVPIEPVFSAAEPVSRPRVRASGSQRKHAPATSLLVKKRSARRRPSKVRAKFDHNAFDETDKHLPTSAETAPAPIWAKLRWLWIRDVELRARQFFSRLSFRDRLVWISLGAAVVAVLGLLAVL